MHRRKAPAVPAPADRGPDSEIPLPYTGRHNRGLLLVVWCPACQRENPTASRFCGGCGGRLSDEAGPDASPVASMRGERRQLTVMFCDLVDSTVLSERLDAEDLCEVIEAYRACCADAVDRFGGHVAQYLGDGILAYFSFPAAHEDDPERAVRAGLEILAGLRETNPRLERAYGIRLAAKVAIHTGPVVLDRSRHQRETLALGRAVNVAARLAGIATPDSVVITRDTLRLVEGLFVTRSLGEHVLRGIVEPIEVQQVLDVTPARGRLDAAIARGLTPMVGRGGDLAALAERFDRAARGTGQVVYLGGDPGIGKSRLMLALRRRLAAAPHAWIEISGSPHHMNSAFHPVTEGLRRILGFAPGDTSAQRLVRVEEALDRAGIDRTEALPLMAAFLSIDLPTRTAPAPISPEVRRRKTLDLLVRWILATARSRPTVFAVEDLHWADPSTLELLDRVIDQSSNAALLILATHRPSFVPRRAASDRLTIATLGPLGRDDCVAMAEAVARGSGLAGDVLRRVVERTDGVPLYVEELTRSVLEASSSPDGETPSTDSDSRIPPTLHDSLISRLHRLGPAQEIIQLAALLGRDFASAHLEEVSPLDPAGLRRALARLEDGGFLVRAGAAPEITYSFRHALIQEAAYQSLLRQTRRAWHARIARTLEQRFPELVRSEPEAVARHCDEGDLVEEATTYYERAADRAAERSANLEAIAHFRRAIDVLERLPEGKDRNQRELRLQAALAAPLVATTGWGSAEAERAYARALALGEASADDVQRFLLTRRVITFHVSRAELRAASALCPRLHAIASHEQDSSLLLLAHQQEAIVLYYLGRPAEALAHYERAVALHDPARHAELLHVHGEDLGVLTRIWMHWALWLAGHPDRALERSTEAIAIANAIRHPFSRAYALLWAAVLRLLRREPKQAHDLASAAMEIGLDQGFTFHAGAGRAIRAMALVEPRQPVSVVDAAVQEFQRAIGEISSTGIEVTKPKILGLLADTFLRVGRLDEANAVAIAAAAAAQRTEQPFWNADLERILGEVALGRSAGARPEAERRFRDAIEIARTQKARALELRAATSLARLLGEDGRREDARAVLAPIYGSFDEGLELPDLREARVLLAELG